MAELSPSGLARRGRIPREQGQKDRSRRRFLGVFSRFKRKPVAPPDASTPETHSVPFQEAHLNSEASLDTRQVVESPPVVTSSTQRSTDDASMLISTLFLSNTQSWIRSWPTNQDRKTPKTDRCDPILQPMTLLQEPAFAKTAYLQETSIQ